MENIIKNVNSFISNIEENLEKELRGNFEKLDKGYSGEDFLIMYFGDRGGVDVKLEFSGVNDDEEYKEMKEGEECIGYVEDGEFILKS